MYYIWEWPTNEACMAGFCGFDPFDGDMLFLSLYDADSLFFQVWYSPEVLCLLNGLYAFERLASPFRGLYALILCCSKSSAFCFSLFAN